MKLSESSFHHRTIRLCAWIVVVQICQKINKHCYDIRLIEPTKYDMMSHTRVMTYGDRLLSVGDASTK